MACFHRAATWMGEALRHPHLREGNYPPPHTLVKLAVFQQGRKTILIQRTKQNFICKIDNDKSRSPTHQRLINELPLEALHMVTFYFRILHIAQLCDRLRCQIIKEINLRRRFTLAMEELAEKTSPRAREAQPHYSKHKHVDAMSEFLCRTAKTYENAADMSATIFPAHCHDWNRGHAQEATLELNHSS